MQQGILLIQDLALVLAVAAVAGWVCQRIGFSVVMGYMIAGVVLAAHPFTSGILLTDPARIERLAHIGLVFLMFGIGMRLSVRRLRRLGVSVLLAVFASAGTIYYIVRTIATGALGANSSEGIFLAAMVMVSSSVIISKVLEETGGAHERAGQTAMGVVVLEDVVAVILVALLGSIAHYGGAQEAHIFQTLGTFVLVLLLACIVGLLLVPLLLRRLSISAGGELQTLVVAALMFGMAFWADKIGYSLGLGAFLLGMIVAETPQRPQVERTFEGMTDVFSSVFFVAIGLQINPTLFVESWGLILGIAVMTIVVRTFAVTLGLSLIGAPIGNALKAGLMVTPIGEFSFIIIQLGVSAALIPKRFFPVAVGVSLMTTLTAPFLTRNAGKISAQVMRLLPHWVSSWSAYYNALLERLKMRSQRSKLWMLSKKRFIQIGVEVLVVTGVMIFSRPLLDLMVRKLGTNWLFPNGPVVLFWIGLTVLILAPLVALWRNVSALSLIYAQMLIPRGPRSERVRTVVELLLKIAAGTLMFVWLSALLPSVPGARWLLLAGALVAGLLLLLLRRNLVRWHSEIEAELQVMVSGPDNGANPPWLASHNDWGIRATSCILPDLADCQGKTLAILDLRHRFGCVVAEIERQGCLISRPGPDVAIYPRDKLLLIGKKEQVRAGKAFLQTVSGNAPESEFDDVRMDTLLVPANSRAIGKDLRTLSPAQHHNVQIIGIQRAGNRILNPGGDEVLMGGDELLATGTPNELQAFSHWLIESTDSADSQDSHHS